jgi:alcohol dehydrogenase class IV
MRFDFATVTKIVFGPGSLSECGAAIAAFGKRALVVGGMNVERVAPLIEILQVQGIAYSFYQVAGEPSIQSAQQGAEQAREFGAEFVIGYGGGSAMDTAKAVSALITNTGDVMDYLEVIGRGQPLKAAAAPLVTIPTTAGTGSEVTSNAVLYSPDHQVKVSLRSPRMLAKLAIVDSRLTHSSPPAVTAQSGLDALTQVIEPLTCNKTNPMTDAVCREGIVRAARSLKRAYEQPDDAAAREDMALTSLFGGLALSNAKLGAVHGFAGPFGGMYDAPHGGICARLLPYVMAMNVQALRERQPESAALERYDEVARLLTGHPKAVAADGVQFVQELCAALSIPALGTYGIVEADYATLIEKAAVASSMQGNPIVLTRDELRQILVQAQ